MTFSSRAPYSINGHAPVVDPSAFVAEGVVLAGQVRIGPGASIWFGSIIRAEAEPVVLGEGSNVQDLCLLHSDPGYPVVVGAAVTVGHRAVLHGCRVGSGALVGIGAVVLNGAEVGEEALVGAGALVPEGGRVPTRTLVVGVPARPLREVTDADLDLMRWHTEHYLELAAAYRDLARPTRFRQH